MVKNQEFKMTIQYINTGSGANAGDGDSLRSAFIKVNNNFARFAVLENATIGYTGSFGDTGYTGSSGAYAAIGYTGSAGAGGVSISDFGEGFSLTVANQIVTNKLYSTNQTQPTQHYRLELDTNGIIILPDQSIINGSTLRGVYGTGDANYTGITIGPDANHREESWVWVDHTGVSIATEYSTSAYTWKFDNNGVLTLPYGQSISSGPLDGIKLTTDRGTVLFGNTPECVPTLASHFHIMRDDPTTVDLFFGDDYNYVKLPYYSTLTNVGVEINADGYSWQFDKSGILTLPSGNAVIGNTFGSDAILGSTDTSVAVVAQGLYGSSSLLWVDDIANIGSSGTHVAAVVVNDPFASSSGTVQIATGLSNGLISNNIWEFGADGTLTIPDDIQDANGSVIRIATTSTAPTRVNGQLWFNTEDGRAYIRYDNNWIDFSPPEVPPPSTYLDGLIIDGTTISTVDSTATTIYLEGDLIPTMNNTYDLGAPENQWKSLYVSTGTIYIGGTPLSVDPDGNLTVAGSPVSGALPSVLGVVTFPGDLLIGTLWPNDPMPMGDKESVVWAKDDTEYLGLWWGGSQTYPDSGYGPVAGIMIGTGDGSMTDDFVQGPSPTGTNITLAINDDIGTLEWVFGRDGELTLPTNGRLGAIDPKGGTMLDGGLGSNVSLTSFYSTGNYSSCVTASAGGTLYIRAYNDGGPNPSSTWIFDKDGSLTLPEGGTIKGGGTGTNVTIVASTGTNPAVWMFEADGVLTLPNAMTIDASDSFGTVKIGGSNTQIRIDDGGAPPGLYIRTDMTGADHGWLFGTDGNLTLPLESKLNSGGVGVANSAEFGTSVTVSTSTVVNSEIYMGSGYGEFRSIYNKVGEIESGLTYAGVEGFNYAQYGDVNFSGMVSQTPHIDSMYTISVSTTTGLISIGFTQDGGTSVSKDWITVLGTLNAYYTVNGIFVDTTQTVIAGGDGVLSSIVKLTDSVNITTIDSITTGTQTWTFGTDGTLTLPHGGTILDTVPTPGITRTKYTGSAAYDVNWYSTATVIETGIATTMSESYDDTLVGGADYSFQYAGYFKAPATGTYTFTMFADDSGRFWIGPNALTGYTAGNANISIPMYDEGSTTTSLTADEFYPIRLQWNNASGPGSMVFSWSNNQGQSTTTDFTGVIFAELGQTAITSDNDIELKINNGTTSTWTFGTDGSTSLASGVEISNSSEFNFVTWNTGSALILTDTVNLNPPSFIYIPSSSDTVSRVSIANTNTTGGVMLVQGPGDSQSSLEVNSGGVSISTIVNNSQTGAWQFSSTGTLKFPDNTQQTTAYTGGGAGFATTSTLVNGTSTVSLSSTGTLTVPGNIIPDADSIYSLGSPTRKFKDLYVSTTTIYMGDLVISGSPSTGLTINGNSANSKQTFVGGEGVGPDNCSWIEWAIGTNYLTVRNPGTNFKLIMEGLKTGNTFNAVSPIDLTFTVSSTLWHFDNELTPDNPEYRIGVNETNVSFSGEFIYLLAVPVPERTNALSNGVYSLTLNSTGTVTLPGLLTLPVTTSIPAITTATGTVAVCDGTLWDGGGDGFEHLMIYINDVWTKVV